MWIKKINEFFDNMSEYDNSSLSLHFSVDLIDILKDRIKFINYETNILPYHPFNPSKSLFGIKACGPQISYFVPFASD